MLQGKVIFRLDLDESSIEIAASRKRKREVTQEPKKNDALPDANLSGFLFFPSPEFLGDDQLYRCYLLSVPHLLARRVSEAAAYNLPVSLTRYVIVPLKGLNQGPPTALLEVWSDGFRLLRQSPIPSFQAHDFWRLSHFRRKEIVEKLEMNTCRRKELYNIVATVDAISPILPLDPRDPFSLVELYDNNNEESTCVLVLNGHSALIWQSAIQPGDTLQIEGLQRKPWNVPEAFAAKPSFQHLVRRIPSFVFIFSTSSKVFWHPSSINKRESAISLFPPLPFPLVSIEGVVTSIVRKTYKLGTRSAQTIHRVVLESHHKPGQKNISSTYLLLLTHFPMSPELHLGVQPGSRILAVNIHPLLGYSRHENGLQAYGACLRSTISLVRTSSEQRNTIMENNSAAESTDVGHCRRTHRLLCSSIEGTSIEGMVPYRLGKIKSSYRDIIFRRHVEKWAEACFDGSASDRSESFPSIDDLMVLAQNDSPVITWKNGVRPGTKSRLNRNVYAEFFDHAIDMDSFSDRSNDGCGCRMTQEESNHYPGMPFLVGLNDLRMAGLRKLCGRLAELATSGSISNGWSGSVHLSSDEIARELDGYGSFVSNEIFVGGFACTKSPHNSEVISLSDRICQLSLRFSDPTPLLKGDFVTGKLVSVVASCFCILFTKTENGGARPQEGFSDSIIVQSLPPLGNTLYDNMMGGGALVRLGNYVLVASVQLRCSDERVFVRKADVDYTTPLRPDLADIGGIGLCLANPKDRKGSSGALKGFVIRSRFRHAKVNSHGLSSCLVLTLSDIAVQDDGSLSPSFLQTIDLKVAVPHNTSKTIAFKRVLAEIVSNDMKVLEDECFLGISWWTIAESCHISPLVAGGWDEWCGDFSPSSSWNGNTAVVLSLPMDSVSTSHRGYVRSSCTIDALHAAFAQTSAHRITRPSGTTIAAFDFIGSGKFFDGMLCRRPARKSDVSADRSRCLGELLSTCHCLITPCSLSDIFILACQSIRTGTPHVLSPSMVRRISQADFLGIGFCCAQCMCMRCFQPLIDTDSNGGGIGYAPDNSSETSFWHLPSPEGLTDLPTHRQIPPKLNQSARCSPHIRNSILRCPNKCDLEHYYVNWECSGFLDDGTGQAKLYAEREAALTLLGITTETINKVEKALWGGRCGVIRYNKSIPPSKLLQEQVRDALSRATEYGPCPLEFLSATARGEYLLHQHCRTSTRPNRKLDYFVRCKPLSDNVSHLNHTTVETFLASQGGKKSTYCGEISSYSLPPIKLELVDCSVPAHY